MSKEKILIVMPYGMCFRQILLNKSLWGYLQENFTVDIMTSIKVSDKISGINSVIDPTPNSLFLKILLKISSKSAHLLRSSKMVNFFLDNDLGENFSLRWKWFGNYGNTIILMSAIKQLKFFGKIMTVLLTFLANLYPTFFLKKKSYKSIVLTHVSDLDCTLLGLGANKLSIPLITITLGLDNYRHGPLLFRSNLMLLWGEEQLYEFTNYHIAHDEASLATKCKKIGSLIHDTYLESKQSDKKDYLFDNYSLTKNQKFILVAAMLEENLPNQTSLCDLLISFLEDHNLEHKLLVRKLPFVDNKIWSDFYNKNKDRVIIQEPKSASFDKRIGSIEFDLESSMEDIGEFVQTLNQSELIVGLYPSTVLIDGLLFNKQCAVPMFNWKNEQFSGGHPQEKFYLSKFYTHPHNKHYNLLYSQDRLYAFLNEVLIEGKEFPKERKEIFLKITGDSMDGNSGVKAANAISSFLNTV